MEEPTPYVQINTQLNVPLPLWQALEHRCAMEQRDVITFFNTLVGPAVHQALTTAANGPLH